MMVNLFRNANLTAIKILLIFCAIFLLLCIQVNASSSKNILNIAEQLDLKNHPVWLKLLHYEQENNHSVVLTNNFFLAPNGQIDPGAELTATINAYFTPWDELNNTHARCRFPARYFWLSHHLPLPGYNLKNTECSALKAWGLLESVKSISLLLVSGYLGNPASTFGHTFLKLNTDSTDDYSALFDSTLNYGAVVPEGENPLRYIVKGVFGGYEAGFSDKYFYTQDLVYSNTEFRDIWDYELVLSDYERTLLILHIWEIVGNKFAYYFLDKNCAYRITELLDLVIEEDLLGNVRLWYLPVELFHSLNDIDSARQKSGKRKLIKSINYIPSSQRKLYSQLKLLTSDELKLFNIIIRKGNILSSTQIEQLTTERQIVLIDSLLAYQQYKIISEKPEFNRERHEAKNQTLLARLQRPISSISSFEIPEIKSPAQGSRPMEFGISIASQVDNQHFLKLNWSPYKKERVGKNSMQGDELVLADLVIGIHDSDVFIDKFDLIRILNLNTFAVKMEDEDRLSWELRLGIDRINDQGRFRHDGIFSFGVGYAWQLNQIITTYGMIALTGHTISMPVRLRPHLGLRFEIGRMQAWLYGGLESVNYDPEFHDIWGGKIHFQLNDRYAIRTEFSNEFATEISIGLCSYW